MSEVKATLYPCKHCNESGVCTTGKDQSSCVACAKYHQLKMNVEYTGLACGTCGGLGMSEPYTERLNKRTQPLLAIGIVFSVLVCVFVLAVFKNPHFSEFLAFAGTLIGSIITFYFTSTSRNNGPTSKLKK